LLGPANSKTTRTSASILESLFRSHLDAWKSGDSAIPLGSDVFMVEPSRKLEMANHRSSIFMVSPHFYMGESPKIESDSHIHQASSAINAGHRVTEFDSDLLCLNGYLAYDRQPIVVPLETVGEEIEKLRCQLTEARPEILYIDGNFIPGKASYDSDLLQSLKSEFGFRLCTIIADCHDLQQRSKIAYWGDVSDSIVVTTFDGLNRHYLAFQDKDKVLLAPSPPNNEALWFSHRSSKDIALGFCGGKGRRRTDYLDFAHAHGVPVTSLYREDEGRIQPNDYMSFVNRSRLSFTSGYQGILNGKRHGFLTYRIWETILGKCVLLHETGTPLNHFLVPFVHYVPVDNVHELVHYSQFLLENENIANEITENALAFYMEHYSSDRFWTRVQDITTK